MKDKLNTYTFKAASWALFSIGFASADIIWPDPVSPYFAAAFTAGAVWFLFKSSDFRFPLSAFRFASNHAARAALTLAARLLQLAPKLGPSPLTSDLRPLTSGATKFSAATLHPTSEHESAESPVTISQLLDILDRAAEPKLTLEINDYRITAEKRTAFDRYVEECIPKDGTAPPISSWIRTREPVS